MPQSPLNISTSVSGLDINYCMSIVKGHISLKIYLAYLVTNFSLVRFVFRHVLRFNESFILIFNIAVCFLKAYLEFDDGLL